MRPGWRALGPSASRGNAEAQYNLGLIFDHGLGVPEDDSKAVRWYRLAAEQGNGRAMSQMFEIALPLDFMQGQELVTCTEKMHLFNLELCINTSMVTCWDGTTSPHHTMCPTDPGGVTCPDGSRAQTFELCPEGKAVVTCWNGTVVPHHTMCPIDPGGVTCPDGSRAQMFELCPQGKATVTCWDGTVVPHETACPTDPGGVTCPDGSRAQFVEQCPRATLEVTCWNGTTVPDIVLCPTIFAVFPGKDGKSAKERGKEWVSAFSREADEEFSDCLDRAMNHCIDTGGILHQRQERLCALCRSYELL